MVFVFVFLCEYKEKKKEQRNLSAGGMWNTTSAPVSQTHLLFVA